MAGAVEPWGAGRAKVVAAKRAEMAVMVNCMMMVLVVGWMGCLWRVCELDGYKVIE